MLKRAIAYRRKKNVIVHPSSQTTDGVWIVSEPCLVLDMSCSDREIGKAVAEALECSRTGVPHPIEWKGIVVPLLRAAGVKSWTTFAKNTTSVEVEADGNALVLVPTKNLGTIEGFEPDLSGRKKLDRSADDETTGKEVRQLLARS